MTIHQVHVDISGTQITHQFREEFDVDPDSFLSMVKLSEYLDDMLFGLEMKFDTEDLTSRFSMTLKVFTENHTLFEDIDSYKSYKTAHRIESRLRNDFSLELYVNNIYFYDEIEEGMIF